MKVICKGYDTCNKRYKCEHSRPHEIIENDNVNFCFLKGDDFISNDEDSCICDNINLRKYKLMKLIDGSNL